MIQFFLAITLVFSSESFAADNSWQTQIITDAETIYKSISLKEFQKPIEFNIIENDSAAASAKNEYGKLAVEMNTGLLKNSRLTPDSLRMIVCHEIGHLFGGAPRKNPPPEWEGPTDSNGKSMMSAEGQADYYASTTCFKKLIDIEVKIIPYTYDSSRVGPILKNKCMNTAGFKGVSLETCYRSALAGMDFLNLVKDFDISCEVHDDKIVETTMSDSYPGRQCRLDTIINGALCNERLPLVMDQFEDRKNTCLSDYARRPKCWYK